MKNVTGLTVFYRTPHLVDISIKAFRKYYPDTALIIVNNSPEDDECTEVLRKTVYESKKSTRLIQLDTNYGHGPGLNRGMKYVKTSHVYIFDSDVEIIKPGLIEDMSALMDSNTYGVGFTRLTTRGGQHADKGNLEDDNVVTYLHPLSCLISMHQYEKFPKFYSGGAPFCETMSAIKDTGVSHLLIKHFPVIRVKRKEESDYIIHHGGSTRAMFGVSSDYKGI